MTYTRHEADLIKHELDSFWFHYSELMKLVGQTAFQRTEEFKDHTPPWHKIDMPAGACTLIRMKCERLMEADTAQRTINEAVDIANYALFLAAWHTMQQQQEQT